MSNEQTRDILLEKADVYAHEVFRVSTQFPKSELFGLTAQLRRAALSVPLNIVEGFARQSRQDHRRFLEIAYASLKEAQYLLSFAFCEGFLTEKTCEEISLLGDEVARMLWAKIQTLRKK